MSTQLSFLNAYLGIDVAKQKLDIVSRVLKGVAPTYSAIALMDLTHWTTG